MLTCIGDLHGQYDKMSTALRTDGLIDESGSWCGGTRTLFFLGDYVDRGPDGIGVIDLVMRLQREAEQAGGGVHALLGNHEVLLLAAHRFGEHPCGGSAGTFHADWLRNGGHLHDLERLQPHHIAWLSDLPAMLRHEDLLLTHADSLLYEQYGASVPEVNAAIAKLLHARVPHDYDLLLDRFSDRLAFWQAPERLARFLRTYGGNRLIHGHTPIHYLQPDAPPAPFVYADGACVNLDGGLYLDRASFVYRA
ncbi:calcineurin-like phosphoesterase family protein [Tumebacillus sp. BK434]|uniref:metallophosphoesterase n=1 Tax=Tumebacillus sp. BK434 TaxID=2512169 RepID=UPI0010EFF118|nr:metallophosphoesterase [Tumebacillus sp. BK434]TCP59125.1 calcineurin-like phosphoesterase family protein [Tumebacillus sp. BK434]